MKTKRMFFVVLLVLCLMVTFSIAYAGGGKKKEAVPEKGPEEVVPQEEVVLRFTDWQGGNEGILKSYKEMIKIFEQENPGYTVEYQQYTVTTYNEFLKPALAGGEAPDLFAVYLSLIHI